MCNSCETTTTREGWIHAFEKAGLGLAPFAFVDCIDTGNVRNGKACDYCGTALRYLFIVRDATGKRFVVGSECIRRVNDRGLVAIADKIEKERARKQRAARKAKKAADALKDNNAHVKAWRAFEAERVSNARRAARALDRRARRSDVLAHDMTMYELLQRALKVRNSGDRALRSITTGLVQYGSISPAQHDFLQRLINSAEAQAKVKKGDSFYGITGERTKARLTCVKKVGYEGAFGPGTLSILRTDCGALIKCFGKCTIAVNDSAVATFTIKSHKVNDYNGPEVKETIVTRITVK